MEDGVFTAAKLYPAHATTNSAHGVTDIAALRPVLERMQRIGKPLLIHGEVTHPEVDVFDREAVFVETVLAGLRRDFPELKIVLEHVTTADGVAFVEEADGPTAATITPHHLVIDPQRPAGGRHPPASLLPAGRQAPPPPGYAAPGGSLRQPALLPRHRYRAPCRQRQGNRLRLRRNLLRADRSGGLCRGVRRGRCARPAGVFRQPERPRLLRPPAQRGAYRAGTPLLRGPGPLAAGATRSFPFRAGERLEWRIGGTPDSLPIDCGWSTGYCSLEPAVSGRIG